MRVPSLERPLPVRDFWRIHPELPGVVLTCDLLVEQGLASARSGDAETRHAVDRIDGEAEAVGLITNGQLQRRVDVALLLVAAHVNVVLMWPMVSEPVDQPRVGVEIENHRLVGGEEGLELAIGQPVRMLGVRDQFEQIHHIHEPDLYVGQSPQLAITTSGSAPWSLLAQSQMPTPFVQCSIAASMSRYWRCTCLSAMMTLT